MISSIFFVGWAGSCCLLWILSKCGDCGMPGRECFCRSMGGRKEWMWAGRKTGEGWGKELEVLGLHQETESLWSGGAMGIGCSKTKNKSGEKGNESNREPWVSTKGGKSNEWSWSGRRGIYKQCALGLWGRMDRSQWRIVNNTLLSLSLVIIFVLIKHVCWPCNLN